MSCPCLRIYARPDREKSGPARNIVKESLGAGAKNTKNYETFNVNSNIFIPFISDDICSRVTIMLIIIRVSK